MQAKRAGALVCVSTLLVASDAWTLDGAACEQPAAEVVDRAATERLARRCDAVARRSRSLGAALRAADGYIALDLDRLGRDALTPFEACRDVRVLYRLGYLDSRLGDKSLSLSELREALEASLAMHDPQPRANAAIGVASELKDAARYEEAARVLDELLRSTAGQLPIELERDIRLNLSRTLRIMGDTPSAEREFEVLKSVLGTRPLTSLELMHEAGLQLEQEHLESARELYVRSRRAAQTEGQRLFEAYAVLHLLELAALTHDTATAERLSQDLQGLKDALDVDGLRDMATAEGVARREGGRLAESRALLEQAMAGTMTREAAWNLDYELGRTLNRLGLVEEARRAFERSIAGIEEQRRTLKDPSLQSALMTSRRKPYQALFELQAAAGRPEAALLTLQRLQATRLEDQVALSAAQAGDGVEDALRRRAAMQDLRRVSEELTAEADVASAAARGAFVAFVVGDTRLWRVIHTDRATTIGPLDITPAEFCDLADHFSRDFDDDDSADRLGSALLSVYDLRPLGDRFAVVLPTCAANLPVAALRIGGKRLVDLAAVAMAPDLSTVRPRTVGPLTRSGINLVLADPKGDLPAAREEGEWLRTLDGTMVRFGDAASGDALRGAVPQLLHFATHTVATLEGPSLVLADQTLSVAAILRRRLRAELVVLASCHSGSRTSTSAGETLSTAFLRTGSHAVLATLRSVDDVFASQVVRAFYRAGGMTDAAGALAHVQRQMARTQPPSRWAAFFLAGSAEAIPAAGRPPRL